jgi:hypothetical protein
MVKLIQASTQRRLTYAEQVANRDEEGHFLYGHNPSPKAARS